MAEKPTLGYYETGMTSLFACQYDQRFSYCMQVPENYDPNNTRKYPLVVLVHGTHRRAFTYRDMFKDFAEKHDCIVMAPLFPAGIISQGELANYKFIKYNDIRFDHVLLSMVDELGDRYNLETDRFFLFGFSGGAHFAHRFFYLHPERLSAVSIGAPGMVTLLDTEKDWHCGVGNMEEFFGQKLNFDAMKNVAVQMIIGAEDTETWEITIEKSSRFWMEGVNDAGSNRLERLDSLKQSFIQHGISVQHDIIPGVAHDGFAMLEHVKAFFSNYINHND